MSFFICNAISLKCVSMNNQECWVRREIININSNEPIFYHYRIKVSKCSGSCNNINDPYSKLCVPDVDENINVKAFNLMSRTNETRHRKWHKTCKCECRLDSSVCNNKPCLNNDKCRCECKELIDNWMCDKGFIWNPSNCESECDKLCDIREHLDYKTCKCRKRLIDKLVEEWGENIDGNKMIYDSILNDYENIFNSCTVYIVLLVIFFIVSIRIASIYFHWYLKRRYTETTIYQT